MAYRRELLEVPGTPAPANTEPGVVHSGVESVDNGDVKPDNYHLVCSGERPRRSLTMPCTDYKSHSWPSRQTKRNLERRQSSYQWS